MGGSKELGELGETYWGRKGERWGWGSGGKSGVAESQTFYRGLRATLQRLSRGGKCPSGRDVVS